MDLIVQQLHFIWYFLLNNLLDIYEEDCSILIPLKYLPTALLLYNSGIYSNFENCKLGWGGRLMPSNVMTQNGLGRGVKILDIILDAQLSLVKTSNNHTATQDATIPVV